MTTHTHSLAQAGVGQVQVLPLPLENHQVTQLLDQWNSIAL